jgi:hypothetical protein
LKKANRVSPSACYNVKTRGNSSRAQELLGLDDRFAVYDLCKKYDIVLYTLEDLERDRETARQLGL